jgi:hypothetical protein
LLNLIDQYCFSEERFHYFGSFSSKAFFPSKIPFPLLHVDTGHNFPETIEFRDRLVKELGLKLIRVYKMLLMKEGNSWRNGEYSSRNSLQTTTLLDAIEEFKFDACIGGARRDEEKHELRAYFFCSWWFWSMGRKKPTSRVIWFIERENWKRTVRVFLFQTGQN